MTLHGVRPSRDAPIVTVRSKSYPTDIQQESIFHLVPKQQVRVEKQATYRSVYAEQARREYKADRKSTASMGPLKIAQDPPSEFLKKRTRDRRPVDAQKHASPNKHSHVHATHPQAQRLPLWESWKPKETPKPVPEAPIKTTKKSTELDSYRAKKDYGRAPNYLEQRKQEQHDRKQQQQAQLQQQQSSARSSQQFVQLPESERVRILEGLKKNWKLLNQEYMKLSLVVDTAPKITRKVTLEAQLKKIEEDIEVFSHKNIVIKA